MFETLKRVKPAFLKALYHGSRQCLICLNLVTQLTSLRYDPHRLFPLYSIDKGGLEWESQAKDH